MPWNLDLCEVTIGVDLPEAVHRLPAFRLLFGTVADTTALCNDLASVYRERAMGCQHNAVYLLEHFGGHDQSSAAEQIQRSITDGYAVIAQAGRELPAQLTAAGLTDDVAQAALRCADSYLDVLHGNNLYHRTTSRYTDIGDLPEASTLAEGFAAAENPAGQ